MAVTINGTSGFTFNNASTQSVGAVGAGSQTWQDVTGSRALSTTYTNSTGAPILVQVFTTCGTVNGLNQLTINGIVVDTYCQASGVTGGTTTGTVPNGGTYSCAQSGASVSIQSWIELR
jgi:hypothetical protein